ncbi:unnamed protein product [Periconia digitata]|uniref:SMP-30/Gluconolactonase/LRE-like region domain-containing protein n=1 Tax=Periconia digitata TaxID=1303443 RepID=A0A9W4UTD3_9PLEO|nr:unnamed protein product [Periconia digitata]
MRILLPTLLFTFAASATPPQNPATVKQLTTYNGFLENIAVRHNGHLLITSLSTPSLLYIDPNTPNTTTPLPPIPGANGISGITELSQDLFVVAAGIWNLTQQRATNISLWTIDFNPPSPPTEAVPTKLLDMPSAALLNGLAAIPGTPLVLASDSVAGVIYKIDVARKTHSLAINDPILGIPDQTQGLGVNGIKVHDGTLFFVNSFTGVLGRFRISRDDGTAIGNASVITRFDTDVVSGIDDFDVHGNGDVYIAAHPDFVFRVGGEGGKVEVVVSGEQVPDPTSLALGRGGGFAGGVVYVLVNAFEGDVNDAVGGVVVIDL